VQIGGHSLVGRARISRSWRASAPIEVALGNAPYKKHGYEAAAGAANRTVPSAATTTECGEKPDGLEFSIGSSF
jgi:hypothetical protein